MEKDKLSLILVQFRREHGDVQKNVMRGIKIVSNMQSNEDIPQLVVFPELWITQNILTLENFVELTMPFTFLAMERDLWISTGAHYIEREGTVKSVATLITPQGSHYIISEKWFPSKPMGERGRIEQGSILDVLEIGGTNVGIVICVDAMYPEVSRILAIKGAGLIINPSSIPENRVNLWRSIAQTRAAENTVYWASVLLTGTRYPDGRAVRGGSIVTDPAGTVIYESGPRQEAVRLEIDVGAIYRQRGRWPYVEDVKNTSFFREALKLSKARIRIM